MFADRVVKGFLNSCKRLPQGLDHFLHNGPPAQRLHTVSMIGSLDHSTLIAIVQIGHARERLFPPESCAW